LPIIDKSLEETFTLIEEGRAYLKEPAMYSDARESLLAYRKKVMGDLVGGRVEALLDAGHDSLVKYKDKLASLGVTAYLFKNLRRNALALKMKDKDIGTGIYRGFKTEYISPFTLYPLNPPYAVPQRNLPQVDIFRWTPYTDLDLGERGNLAQAKGMVLIQSGGGTFLDTPDVENALYDFLFLYPQCRVRGRWTFTTPYEPNYEAWSGEYVLFVRELHTANTHVCYAYYVAIWVENDVERPANTASPRVTEPIFSWIQTKRREQNAWYIPSNAPVTEIAIMGRRIPSSDERLFGTIQSYGFMTGYNLKALSFGVDVAVNDWYNSWQITISVNNIAYGTTDPVPDTYTKQALDGFWVEALPSAPHVFDHWELDGLNIGNVNPYYMYPVKDAELKAVFT